MQDTLIQAYNSLMPFAYQIVLRYCYRTLIRILRDARNGLVVNQGGRYWPEYRGSPGTGQRSPLRHPVFAARSDDGSYLIVDELGREKLVPYGFGCRTIRVDADHNILYDSLANGIEDGFGCLMDNGRMAILRRTNWELLIVSPDGEVTDRLRLATFSKRLPWSVAWTCNKTFLIVFVNKAYDLDIIEIDQKDDCSGRFQRTAEISVSS